MTEEKKINTESVNETTPKAIEETAGVVNPVPSTETKDTDRATHKPSNLRGRWKRNSAGTATIKEDDSKLPKEIKAVKLSTAERVDKPTERKRASNYEKTEKCSTDKSCCCCSFLCKVKHFVLALFGIKPKKVEKKYNKNPRGRRYPNARRRGNYRNNTHNAKR